VFSWFEVTSSWSQRINRSKDLERCDHASTRNADISVHYEIAMKDIPSNPADRIPACSAGRAHLAAAAALGSQEL
jgi:hypothetical protein